MIDSEDTIRTQSSLKQFTGAKNMTKAPKFRSTESLPFVNLDAISEQLIEGSLHSVPLYVGLAFANEYKRHDIDKRAMETVIRDLQTVVDETQETNKQLNKELGHLSAKNDQLIREFNEQTVELESLLKAMGKKPFTNNVVLDLAIAIAELQTKGK